MNGVDRPRSSPPRGSASIRRFRDQLKALSASSNVNAPIGQDHSNHSDEKRREVGRRSSRRGKDLDVDLGALAIERFGVPLNSKNYRFLNIHKHNCSWKKRKKRCTVSLGPSLGSRTRQRVLGLSFNGSPRTKT